jgi:hypothetical protein
MKWKWIAIVALAPLACLQRPAHAEDAAAQYTLALFDQACMQNFGNLDRVRVWALDRDLAPISNPLALQIFLGNRVSAVTHERSVAGGGVLNMGQAWAVPAPSGHFVLSTRYDPESCIVWAQAANAGEVEAGFKGIVDGARKPGVQVTVDQDKTIDVPDASVHVQVIRVWTGQPDTAFALALASVNRSGGPFQAMIQTQRLIAADDPIDPEIPLTPPQAVPLTPPPQ